MLVLGGDIGRVGHNQVEKLVGYRIHQVAVVRGHSTTLQRHVYPGRGQRAAAVKPACVQPIMWRSASSTLGSGTGCAPRGSGSATGRFSGHGLAHRGCGLGGAGPGPSTTRNWRHSPSAGLPGPTRTVSGWRCPGMAGRLEGRHRRQGCRHGSVSGLPLNPQQAGSRNSACAPLEEDRS